MHSLRGVAIASIVVGIAAMVASWFWPQSASGRWTDEQAKSLQAAGAAAHRLNYESAMAADREKRGVKAGSSLSEKNLGSVDPASASANRLEIQFAAASDTYRQQYTALEDARAGGRRTAIILRWLGIGLALAGACSVFVLNSRNAS